MCLIPACLSRVRTAAAALILLVSCTLVLGPAGARAQGTGSGFVVRSDGTIVTCYHVVHTADKSTPTITVVLAGTSYPATIIRSEPEHDLTLLHINAENLQPLNLANTENVTAGTDVRAYGFPLDVSSLNTTKGSITGIEYITRQDIESVRTLLTDASINPGNSGGPLVNEYGEVVGVINAKLVGPEYSGVGFAVHVDYVKSLLQSAALTYEKPEQRGSVSDGGALYAMAKRSVCQIRVTGGEGSGGGIGGGGGGGGGEQPAEKPDTWTYTKTDDDEAVRLLCPFLISHGADAKDLENGTIRVNRGEMKMMVTLRTTDDVDRLLVYFMWGLDQRYIGKKELTEFVNNLNRKYNVGTWYVDTDNTLMFRTQMTFMDTLTWKAVDGFLGWCVQTVGEVIVQDKTDFLKYGK